MKLSSLMMIALVTLTFVSGASAERINADRPPAKKDPVLRIEGHFATSSAFQAALQRKFRVYVSEVGLSQGFVAMVANPVFKPMNSYYGITFKFDNGSAADTFTCEIKYDRLASDETAFGINDCEGLKFRLENFKLTRNEILGISKTAPSKPNFPFEN